MRLQLTYGPPARSPRTEALVRARRCSFLRGVPLAYHSSLSLHRRNLDGITRHGCACHEHCTSPPCCSVCLVCRWLLCGCRAVMPAASCAMAATLCVCVTLFVLPCSCAPCWFVRPPYLSRAARHFIMMMISALLVAPWCRVRCIRVLVSFCCCSADMDVSSRWSDAAQRPCSPPASAAVPKCRVVSAAPT